MRFKIEISKKNEIRVWDTENPNELNAPFFYQPSWPDGTEWANRKEAKDWADLFIESIENPESQYLPGNSPDQPQQLRPDPVEIDPDTGEPITEA